MLFLYIAMLLPFIAMLHSVCSLLLWFRWIDVPLSLLFLHSSVHSLIYMHPVLSGVEVFMFVCFLIAFCYHTNLFSRMEMHVLVQDHAGPRERMHVLVQGCMSSHDVQ